ncbi:SIMPL domain-containing protein [uncultured Sphingomonas sp.]|uniref:SIMPL domain-containing protein n=1 Tax=uncultured Sphingomonas sp. TaxID=158754 RepID=UPI003749A25F
MTRWLMTAALGALAATAASAQKPEPRIVQVTANGVVETVPDVAVLTLFLRGEGPTPDAATGALATRQKAVEAGLTGLLRGDSEITTGNVTVIEARGKTCEDGRGYNSTPRLSTGECAILGYIATMQNTLRTHRIDKAATAVGLASRLGAGDARLERFVLSDPDKAQARARSAAIANARMQATALATGAGVRLGPILTLRDQMGSRFDAAEMAVSNAVPPPPPPPPPIDLKAKPQPIETRAEVYVTYAIAD